MSDYRFLGRPAVKNEFTVAHCRRLRGWFAPDGAFLSSSTPPSSRERLWNSISLLALGTPSALRLADAIIRKTPIDDNKFEPVAAAELHLRYRDRLSPAALRHLRRIVEQHLLSIMEYRFGSSAVHNFTAMTTFFLLAAARILDRYAFPLQFASIREVYTPQRLHQIGLNAVKALAFDASTKPSIHEWNSPTYSPVSLQALAKIVECIDDPEAKQLALDVQFAIWRELLAMYHPALDVSCGPYSRAYRIDVLGQSSSMRILMCYLGLSRDRSIVELFDQRRKGLIFHHDGDVPFTWSMPAWQLATRYPVPSSLLDAFRARRYPHRFRAPIAWEAFGHIDHKKRTWLPVQGTALPGGEGYIHQLQGARWSLGYRSAAKYGHSFAVALHYALAGQGRSMREVRNVLPLVMFQSQPDEWVPDQEGRPMEAPNFNHSGHVEISGRGRTLRFQGHPLPQLAPLPTREISVNMFVPTHFRDVECVRMGSRMFAGEPLELRARECRFGVRDAGCRYSLHLMFDAVVTFRLYRWAHFIRCAAFLYQGPPRRFTAKKLGSMRVHGQFCLTRPPEP